MKPSTQNISNPELKEKIEAYNESPKNYRPDRLKMEKRKGLIPYMECFGPTIQGEGMVIGQKTIFVRTAFCQYSCSWCDSKFTWDGSQEPEWITPHELEQKVLALSNGGTNCKHITLTGGNPSLVGEEMAEFIRIMKQEHEFKFSVETQGVNWQDWFVDIDDFVMSPKPPSSLMKTNWRVLDKIVDRLNENNVNWTMKVVIFNDEDFEYARTVVKRYEDKCGTQPMYVSVGNEDSTSAGDVSERLLEKLHWLWDKVLGDPDFNNVRPLPQLHTLVYANARGV